MRKTMLMAAALAAVMVSSTALADSAAYPPVMVGPVVIGGSESREMIDELAHERNHHYHRASSSLDWLSPSVVTPMAGVPTVMVANVPISGHEAEVMIRRLSRLRHHGRWHAGDSLDWLVGGQVIVVQPVPEPVVMMAPPPAPVVMMAPPPVCVMAPPAPVVMVAPPAPAPLPAPPPVEVKPVEPSLARTMIGLQAQGTLDHASASLGLTVEGRRWGFNVDGAMSVLHIDKDSRSASFKMLDAHLVFAPITGERGRARLEVGAVGAFEGKAFMLAPEIGISGDIRIIGPVGLLVSAHGAIWPYTRWDVYGGLFVKAWFLRVELGWREMRLNGKLQDGTAVCDKWSGPFLGTTLVF